MISCGTLEYRRLKNTLRETLICRVIGKRPKKGKTEVIMNFSKTFHIKRLDQWIPTIQKKHQECLMVIRLAA